MSESRVPLEFPRIEINAQELVAEIERLLELAQAQRADLGAVNWADLGVADVEYRASLLYPDEIEPHVIVRIQEASPNCGLPNWLRDRIQDKFPQVGIECEW